MPAAGPTNLYPYIPTKPTPAKPKPAKSWFTLWAVLLGLAVEMFDFVFVIATEFTCMDSTAPDPAPWICNHMQQANTWYFNAMPLTSLAMPLVGGALAAIFRRRYLTVVFSCLAPAVMLLYDHAMQTGRVFG